MLKMAFCYKKAGLLLVPISNIARTFKDDFEFRIGKNPSAPIFGLGFEIYPLKIESMKTLMLFLVFILFVTCSSQAQKDSIVLNKFYKAWIMPVKGKKVISGVLYEVKDSSVIVSNSPWKKDYYDNNFDVTTVDIRNIDEINVRRKGKGFAILAGGVSGIVVGCAISAAYSKSLTKSMTTEEYLKGGGLLGILPALISTAIGLATGGIIASKTEIPVRGNRELYDRNVIKLNEYALKPNSSLKTINDRTFSKLRDSVTDIDGNIYRTLALGGQVWMAEDLKTTRFRDGSEIFGMTGDVSGKGESYNWYVISDNRSLCPAGWHVPTSGAWTSLFNSLGGEELAAEKLKEGFSARDKDCQWWSSTETDADHAQSFYLNKKPVVVMVATIAKTTGLSVRCIRDN